MPRIPGHKPHAKSTEIVMDSREEMEDGPDGATKIQRACDPCRSRKVRCDRARPCSNCKASKLTCQTTAPAQKTQKQRVHISDEYERKIDRIEDRLSGIEHVLEALATKLGNLDLSKGSDKASPNSNSRSSKSGNASNANTDTVPETPAPFEGETTMNSQSEYARELLEKAVGSTPSMGQNAEVQAALTSLQGMVSKQNQPILTTNEPQPLINRALAAIDSTTLERPSWDQIEDILEQATTRPTMCFAVVFPFLKMHNLTDIFKDTFGIPEACSSGRRCLVYGVLYQLFTEFSSYPIDGAKLEKYKHSGQLCKMQMEVAMSQLDLFLPATYENILALVLAAAYAVEICKPSLCWILNSMAVSLCQTLGYHRISSMADDSEEERTAKIHIFWFAYVMDKTLSLRLGRASAIQDWDMSLPFPCAFPSRGTIPGPTVAADMQLYWIKVAQVQGQVYEKLYSPAAFLKAPEERAQIARELSSALNEAWAMRGDASVLDFMFSAEALAQRVPKVKAMPNDAELPSSLHRDTHSDVMEQPLHIMGSKDGTWGKVGDLFHHGDAIVHYSTITLIQKAISPKNNTFNQECLDSARAALAAHQRASEQFNLPGNEELWSGYLHWSVLQSPFTPFIVLFCNSLREPNSDDLASLSKFVLSLESCRTLSEGADKLYKMCHLFLQVAKLYVEARTKEIENQRRNNTQSGVYVTSDGQQTLDFNAITQFDPYLSALGLMTNSAWPMASFPGQMGTEGAGGAEGTEGFGVFDGTGNPGGPIESAGWGTTAPSGNQNSLQDWFSGSRYIMGLMEEDILMPDQNF